MRNGLAPVVATVILMLIVIVAGEGTYAWISSVIAGEQAEAEQVLNTDLTVEDVVAGRYGPHPPQRGFTCVKILPAACEHLLGLSGNIPVWAPGTTISRAGAG